MGNDETKRLCTIKIKIESKADGIYVSSDDMPGLWLWGDPDIVSNDIIPTIRELFLLNEGKTVVVKADDRPQSNQERLRNIEKMPERFAIYECNEMRSSELHG